MLFRALGHFAARRPVTVIAAWIALVIMAVQFAPDWKSIVLNGEFAFLPEDSDSIQGLKTFQETFPEDSNSSNIVIVVRRDTSGNSGLVEQDYEFISKSLLPLVRRISGFAPLSDEPPELDEFNELNERTDPPEDAGLTESDTPSSLVRRISWRNPDEYTGPLYDSVDRKASLIVLELNSEFLDARNRPLISELETELENLHRIAVRPPAKEPEATGDAADSGDVSADITPEDAPIPIPPGLDIAFSGTAIYGRDAMLASEDSAKATETWTVILVIVLLLMMYRAPFLAMIPLLTVSVSGAIALKLLSIAAVWGWVDLFNGIEAYVTVLVYGAGIDYCLFLIARYREELGGGATIEEAISETLARVGSAIAASAGTTMCGIGMMYFADFGKFQQAGIAISFGLFVCLCASLTLTPAIIRLCGSWAFWPRMPARQASQVSWVTRTDFLTRILSRPIPGFKWKRVGQALRQRPWAMWLGSVLGMLPFSIIGYVCFGYLSYGLLSDLPPEAPSVHGARALQAHFPGGEGVPVRVIVEVPQSAGIDFTENKPALPPGVVEFTDTILAHKDELGIQAVRSLADPKGGRDIGRVPRVAERFRGIRLFASKENTAVTRLDIIFRNDPFSRSSLDEFQRLKQRLPEFLPDVWEGATITIAGETANLTDLKKVTDSDRVRINTLVTVVVFIILWILLRQLKVCVYLIVTVLFSYFATLGGTYLFFWALDPSGFAGLDWKVPMFLFTILIAVGEDYNIFLLTRIEEERKRYGRTESITVALDHTGSIISSCGIIMAGTFSSLMAGSLAGMDQLGFALALGVILDTFVVRPVMVPAFLILMSERRLGLLSDPPLADAATADDSAAAAGETRTDDSPAGEVAS